MITASCKLQGAVFYVLPLDGRHRANHRSGITAITSLRLYCVCRLLMAARLLLPLARLQANNRHFVAWPRAPARLQAIFHAKTAPGRAARMCSRSKQREGGPAGDEFPPEAGTKETVGGAGTERLSAEWSPPAVCPSPSPSGAGGTDSQTVTESSVPQLEHREIRT